MALNPLETSTHLGFHWFLDMNKKLDAENLKLISISENDLSYKSKIRWMRENTAEEICTLHQQPRAVYPIIYSFADGIQHLLLNHNITAHDIIGHVIEHREDTLTFAELQKRQISYLAQTKEALQTAKTHMLIGNLFRMEKSLMLAQSIFTQPKTAMTDNEAHTLNSFADKIELRRHSGFDPNIILPHQIPPRP